MARPLSGNARTYSKLIVIDVPQDMRRFDRLPPDVRRAVREASGSMAMKGLSGLVKEHGSAVVARALRAADRAEVRQFYEREFGPEGARQILGDAYDQR